MTMKVNINDTVRVKLTSTGLGIIRQRHFYAFGNMDKFSEPHVDSEGYSSFQLWDLMQTFGSTIRLGASSTNLPFDGEILIGDK